MNHKSIAQKIIALKNADLALRDQLIQSGQLGDGYNKEMESLHNSNVEALNEIIDIIGYPTIDKVGQEANEATWLVIQHAISRPHFMRRCASLLEQEANKDLTTLRHLAYLTDRIAVFEGKPQHYGTQFDWDKSGQLSPNPIDDLMEVNRRRQSVGLNTLEEQTAIIRRQAEQEHQFPPKDLKQRNEEMDRWKKRVGWIA